VHFEKFVDTRPVAEDIPCFNGNQEPRTVFETDGTTGAILDQVDLAHNPSI
jgi:hypothetical protein